MINNKQQQKNRGAALIMALLVIVICAILATIVVSRTALLINITSDIEQQSSLNLYSNGALLWAKWVLSQAATHPQRYPISMQTGIEKNFKINAVLYDQNALFNLNSLNNSTNKMLFTILLSITNPTLPKETIQNIINNIKLPMIIPTQLLLTEGMTKKIYKNIAPYITALPNNNQNMINLNDAPDAIIAMLLDTNLIEGRHFVAARKNTKLFSSLTEANLFLKNIGIVDKTFYETNSSTAPSQYFLLKINIISKTQHFHKQIFLQRTASTTPQSAKIQTIWVRF